MKTLLSALALLCVPFSAMAGEEDLYAPVPPADSAFVRTVNLTADDGLAIQLDGAAFPAGDVASVSNYAVIKQGAKTLTAGDRTQPLTIEAKQYYTIAVPKTGEAKLLKDAPIENPAKAMIYFYNLSDAADAALDAPSHKATIFEKVAAGTNASRDINATTIDLAVKADGAEVTKLEKIELVRQAGVSIFLTGEKGLYKAFSIMNKVAQ